MSTWWSYVERVARAAGDVTQKEIAARAGIDQATVSRWSEGGHPSFEAVKKFAKGYGEQQVLALITAGYLDEDAATIVEIDRPLDKRPTDEVFEIQSESTAILKRRLARLRKNGNLNPRPDAPTF